MARKKNQANKKKPQDSNNSEGGDSNDSPKNQNNSSAPWKPKEVAEELKLEGEAEAVRILRWLEVTAISNGNTLDMKSLKKQLKESFGIEFNNNEESRPEEEPIAEKLGELKVKKWQKEQ